MLPFVAGQGDEFRVARQGFGGNADLGNFVNQHSGHLVWRALVQADVDFGVGQAQLGHGFRQDVTRLCVGGGNRQGAAVLRMVLLANTFEVAQFAHDDVNAFEHMLARLGDAFEALAVARKNLDAQFFFQLDDGFGDAGLGGVQGFGRFRQVEVASNGFLNKTELVQVHIKFQL